MVFHKNNVDKLTTTQYKLGVLFVAKAVLIMKGNFKLRMKYFIIPDLLTSKSMYNIRCF